MCSCVLHDINTGTVLFSFNLTTCLGIFYLLIVETGNMKQAIVSLYFHSTLHEDLCNIKIFYFICYFILFLNYFIFMFIKCNCHIPNVYNASSYPFYNIF